MNFKSYLCGFAPVQKSLLELERGMQLGQYQRLQGRWEEGLGRRSQAMLLRGDSRFGLHRRAKSLTTTEACCGSQDRLPSMVVGDYPGAPWGCLVVSPGENGRVN